MAYGLSYGLFCVCGGWVGSVGFPAKLVGSVRVCGFDDVCVWSLFVFNVYKNKSIVGFWVGFGLVLELYRVVWMVGY